MSPAFDGKVGIQGEVTLYPEFWQKVEETIYSSLFFEKLKQSLEAAGELPWYDIREYKLDEARTDELITEFPERGDCLRVLSYTGLATIKFDSPTNPSFNLNTYEKIRWGFNKLYLTNTAQAEKKIEILFAKGDFGLKKAIQPIEPFGELANENLAVLTDWTKIADELIIARHIAAHVIDVNKLNVATHFLSGATWSNNSPGAGSVAWAGASVTYNGHTYTITNGNTDKKYIWWDFSLSVTTFQTSDAQPTLADQDCIVAYNDSGTHILIWNATLIDGRNVRTGTIEADKLNVVLLSAISANIGTVTAGLIKSTDEKTQFDLTNGFMSVSDGTYTRFKAGKLNGAIFGVEVRDEDGILTVDEGEITQRWRKIYDGTITGSAVDSFVVPDLNGNADIEYIIRMRWVGGGSAAAQIDYNIRPNADAAANYGEQNYGSFHPNAPYTFHSEAENGFWCGRTKDPGQLSQGISYLNARSGYERTCISIMSCQISGNAVIGGTVSHGVWNNTVANITSLTFASEIGDTGIGIGSRTEIWKRVA